jgi:hypothetical protein
MVREGAGGEPGQDPSGVPSAIFEFSGLFGYKGDSAIIERL